MIASSQRINQKYLYGFRIEYPSGGTFWRTIAIKQAIWKIMSKTLNVTKNLATHAIWVATFLAYSILNGLK